jgi:hypothetical protein
VKVGPSLDPSLEVGPNLEPNLEGWAKVLTKLPFLDVLVKRTNNSIDCSVYRKPIDTGECPNFNNLSPVKYKMVIIKYFLHRAYAITSNWENMHSLLQIIQKLQY